MGYTVKAVADVAGVSVRTLHHYDRIGLLRPAASSPAGYRLYSEADLERLQQVLFFRELGFSLQDVKAIVDSPTFDRTEALRAHRRLLVEQQGRLGRLVDRTIASIEKGEPMSNQERFGAFDNAKLRRGKVRDIYAVGDDQLLVVSTDRVSAFDVVMPNPIPDRGKVLTQLSTFWFRQTGNIVPNHLIADDLASFPESVRAQAEVLEGRSMLVHRAKRIDIECVARGYISGSAWSEYKKQGTACGIKLPEGLVESQQLPEPIFTPAIKADTGHDENISFKRLVEIVGAPLAEQLRDVTLSVYSYAAKVAGEKGIIIADTKMEFGHLGDELILIDELLTPDSSRFWDAAMYEPGKTPASFDKQYLRDWLEQSGWNKEPPAPELPEEVVTNARRRYIEALERLTGRVFEPHRQGPRHTQARGE